VRLLVVVRGQVMGGLPSMSKSAARMRGGGVVLRAVSRDEFNLEDVAYVELIFDVSREVLVDGLAVSRCYAGSIEACRKLGLGECLPHVAEAR